MNALPLSLAVCRTSKGKEFWMEMWSNFMTIMSMVDPILAEQMELLNV